MGLRLLTRSTVADRLFPAWAMRDDPARSWLWTKTQMDDGALDHASAADILAVFHRIVDEGLPA